MPGTKNGGSIGGDASLPDDPAAVLLDAGAPGTFVVLDGSGAGNALSPADAQELLNSEGRVYLPASPTLRWSCDEASGTTLANSGSTSSADLTVAGSPDVGRPTPLGRAVVWTGNGSGTLPTEYASGAAAAAPTAPITILAWCSPRAFTRGYAKIVYRASREPWAAPTGHGLRLAGGGEAGVGAGGWVAEIAVGGAETSIVVSDAWRRLVLGAWQMLALTYDGSALRAYLNGYLVGSSAVSGALDNGSTGTRLWMSGGNPDVTVSSECFDGAIREATVYGSALSAANLARIYEQGVFAYGASS